MKITKADFLDRCLTMTGLTPVAKEQTLAGWLVSGRVTQTIDAQSGAISIDDKYLASEARRSRRNAALRDGTIRG